MQSSLTLSCSLPFSSSTMTDTSTLFNPLRELFKLRTSAVRGEDGSSLGCTELSSSAATCS